MNANLAKNVRSFRQIKNWTQQHCADAVGIQLRTLQRVESAEGASAETLSALAAGFNVSVSFLQTDLEALAAQIQKEQEDQKAALLKTHDLVPVTPVVASADLNVIQGAEGSIMDCRVKDDAVQDVFAALQTEITDIVEIWEDVSPVQRREWMRSAFEEVEKLNQLGCVVSMGKRRATYKTGRGALEIATLYVVVWTKDEARDVIAVERGMPL